MADRKTPVETVEIEPPGTETQGSMSPDGTENRTNVGESLNQDAVRPLYLQSPAYAREHGELEQYRESRRLNIACKDAIEKAVSDNFDGMHLNPGAVKPVVDQFGEERVAYVLATTIQMKDWDRRFSPSNKEWAASVPIGEEISLFGNDRRLEWTVESHPAVLDGFVRMFQEEVQEQVHEMEQELTADEITNFKEISREYYPHMRTAEYVFSCEVRGEPDVLTYEVSQHDDGESYSFHTTNHDIWERMSRKELEKLESVMSREVTLNQWLQEIEKADSPEALREVQYGLWESEHLNLTDEQIDVIYKRMDEKEKTFPVTTIDGADQKETAEATEIAEASEKEEVTGEPEKVSVAFYYVDSDVNGERTESSFQTFPNVDLALGAYVELPNHWDKEIGMESTETPPSRMALIRCKNGVDTVYDMEEESLSGKWVTQETIHAQNIAQYVLDNHDIDIAYHLVPANQYFDIHTCPEGYEYTFYDNSFHEIDGGMLANTDITMEEAIEDILSDAGLSTWPAHREVMDYWELADKVHTVSQEEIQKAQEKAQEETQKMIQEEKSVLSEEQQKEVIPLISDRTEPCISLNGKSMADIEETVLCYAQAEIDSMGLQDEVKLLGARVYGSRSREGLYTNGSDLDVVLSYIGNITEDSFFNALHESGLSISGMPVDINPISTEKTGTLTEYLQKADQYLDEKAAQMAEQTQAQDASVKQKPVEPRITFYVAECMEFPILGEWHEEITSLSEAVALYEKIPAERMNGIKGIGFTLYDGSMYDGMPQEMMSAGIVDRADVNEIQQFKESPLVQKALDELEAVYPPERTEKNVVQAEVTEASVHEERTASEPQKTPQTMPEKMVQTMPAENSKENRESNDRGSAVAAGGRKESVLQALRDRKAKMKEQEKTSGKEQDRKADRKKGEQSL